MTTERWARWIDGFRARALADGIADEAFARAFEGARFDPRVLERDRAQGEFTRSIGEYLDRAVSAERVAAGFAALVENGTVLARIAATWDVPAEIIVAIWGLETNYGRARGDHQVIAALATLAFEGRRAAFFEAELLAALRIDAAGDIAAGAIRGSWAGAMGHTQFMPTSYLAHAVDFDGDGRRDIWSDDPTDALASTAAYLAQAGWQAGQPWAVEAVLPPGFNLDAAEAERAKPVHAWRARAVEPARDASSSGGASLLLPAGIGGPAFLAFANFGVLSRYNAADAYVLAVGHLADRLGGGRAFRGAWPGPDDALDHAGRVEVQMLLGRAGFDAGAADGRIGPRTAAAVRAFQRMAGLQPDGHADAALLARLRDMGL